jgi:hypothetical protein
MMSDDDTVGLRDRRTGHTCLLTPIIRQGDPSRDRALAIAWAVKAGRPLRNCDLRGAQLVGLDLSGRDLSDTDLTNANLSGCKLRGANLSGAELRGVRLVDAEAVDAGQDMDGGQWIAIPHDDGLRIAHGDRWMDFPTAWSETSADDAERHARLRMIHDISARRGWPLCPITRKLIAPTAPGTNARKSA